MKNELILETYRKLGIGTQIDREKFLKWYPEPNKLNEKQFFIIETPNSVSEMEVLNAELARDS